MIPELNLDRARILSSIRDKPKTITELSKQFKSKGFSRANIYLYLKELKDKGLVADRLATEKEGKRVPRLFYATPTATPLSQKYWDMVDKVIELYSRT